MFFGKKNPIPISREIKDDIKLEDELNFKEYDLHFEKLKITSISRKTVTQPLFVCKWKTISIFGKWMTTSFFVNVRQPPC